MIETYWACALKGLASRDDGSQLSSRDSAHWSAFDSVALGRDDWRRACSFSQREQGIEQKAIRKRKIIYVCVYI